MSKFNLYIFTNFCEILLIKIIKSHIYISSRLSISSPYLVAWARGFCDNIILPPSYPRYYVAILIILCALQR